MKIKIVAVGRLVGHIAYLRQGAHLLYGGAGSNGIGQSQVGLLPHPVHQPVGLAANEYRRLQAVLPIVIMRQAAQRGLDAADYYRHVGIKLLEDVAVDGYGIVGTIPGTALGSVGVVAAQALAGGVVVHHRIHRAGRYAKVEARPSQFLEITQVVAPVGLRDHRHPVTAALEHAGYHRRTKRRMVYESIPGKQDDVGLVPSQRLHLFFTCGYG